MKQRGHILNGPVVRALRIIAGLSVRDAAAQLGVSAPTWSQWESGKRGVADRHLADMAALLGLDEPAPLLAATASEAFAEAERQRQRRNRPVAA